LKKDDTKRQLSKVVSNATNRHWAILDVPGFALLSMGLKWREKALKRD